MQSMNCAYKLKSPDKRTIVSIGGPTGTMKEITIAIEWLIQTIQRGLSVVCQPGNYSDKVFSLDSLAYH